MPTNTPTQSTERDLPRSRRKPVYRGVIPSWFFSIWFHILLLFAAAVGLRSCTGRGDRGESDAEWKTVGLVMRTNTSDAKELSRTAPDANPQDTPPEEPTFAPTEIPTVETDPIESTAPSFPDALTDDLPPVIGPGSGMPSFPDATEMPSNQSRVATAPIAPSGLARGETEFLNIRDKGQRFVYVIDVSGSMSSPPTAIRSAKSELLASLASLSADQQFQVIFFNERPHILHIQGQRRGEIIPATDINRTLARQEIAAVRPNLGTRPMPAIKMALKLEPDVVFFLTDAGQGALTPREIEEITRLNDGDARIHAIEFGKDARLVDSSSMQRLAEQNGGAFQYYDVNQFDR